MLEGFVGERAHRSSAGLARGSDDELARPRTSALRKIAVAFIGAGVLIFGVALIVLPGPAIVVIPLGLAILAREFPWARRLLDRLRRPVTRLKDRARQAFRKIAHAVGTGRRALRPE